MKNKKTLLSLCTFVTLFLSLHCPFSLFAQTYNKGDKVEVLWQGAWQKARIEHVMKENLYKVHFSGYWASREEIVSPDRIRPIAERGRPNVGNLKSGEAIEFLEGDHWRPAIFVEASDNKVLVRYADGVKDKEKWIPASHLSIVPVPPGK